MSLPVPSMRITILAVSAVLFLGACNTMRGVGKDTEAVGEKIQDEAEQHIDEDKKDESPSLKSP